MRWLLMLAVLGLVALPGTLANENPWTTHAHAPLAESNAEGLLEVYAPSSLDEEPPRRSDSVEWKWWSWSEETGSSWPDDDAQYRASIQDISLNVSSPNSVVDWHEKTERSYLKISGEVKVVSAEDGARMVAFEFELTPMENLSEQTILYVVLTEDRAIDQHQRQLDNLVREMRPEVGFSLKGNNSTSFRSIIPADHLEAAGVDLSEHPTGWSYTVAVFGGGAVDETSDDLIWMAHGRLPSPAQHITSSQAWTPLLLTAITAVIAGSIVTAIRQREKAIPQLRARWKESAPNDIRVTLVAGTHPFRVTSWSAMPPWRFKGRPPNLHLDAGETRGLDIQFKENQTADCHIDVAINIDDFGGWNQRLWLRADSQAPTNDDQKLVE